MRTARAALARSIASAACCFVAAGCEAMVPYHWDSAERDGERVKFVLDTVDAQDSAPMTLVMPRGGRRAALRVDPIMIEMRIVDIVSRVQWSAERPPSSWGTHTAGDFYAAPPHSIETAGSDSTGVRVEVRPGVRGFRLERWIYDELATTLEFSIEPGQDAFRITLDRITLHYSRCKVADCSWVNWWTRIPLLYGFTFDIGRVFGAEYGDNAVDMQIDLGFTAVWTDAQGESRFAPIAVMGWTVLDVPFGGKPHAVGQSSGWLPMPPPSVTESASGVETFGRGHFALWTLVTEQDDLTREFVAERKSVNAYFEQILGLLPVPTPTLP